MLRLSISNQRELLGLLPQPSLAINPCAYTSFVLDGQQDPSVALSEVVDVAKGCGRVIRPLGDALSERVLANQVGGVR